MLNLSGKVAIVTGASRGIGRAVAERLSDQGATIVAVARGDHAREVVDGILARGRKADAVSLDITDSAVLEKLPGEIVERHGQLDIVVANAGITRDQLLARMTEDDWRSVIDTNLTGAYHVARRAIAGMMKARWGRLIFVSSVGAYIGAPGQANYAATKAGMIGFARSIAREYATRGITANVVTPGPIDTDMIDALTDAQRDQLLGQVPVGRLGSAAEVAAAVRFLASPEASFITGAVLPVDGGAGMGF